jgi:hypothetical protein
MRSTEVCDVLNHGVPVLGSACQTRKDKQRWVGITPEIRIRPFGSYVSRTTHDVVIPCERLLLQMEFIGQVADSSAAILRGGIAHQMDPASNRVHWHLNGVATSTVEKLKQSSAYKAKPRPSDRINSP